MRKSYIDNIRWCTVLIVLIYHVFFLFSSVTPDMGLPFSERQPQDGVMYLLYPWLMLILFIISGMSARYYLEKHTIRAYIGTRTTKLLVPSTIGIIVFGWVQGYVNMRINHAFETIPDTVPKPVLLMIMMLSGTGVLWFLQQLWLTSMLLALVRRFEKGRLYAFTRKTGLPVIILLVIPLWASGQILNMPVISVYRFGLYTFAFFIGYFIFAHETVIEHLRRSRFFFIPAAIILGLLYLWLHFGDNYAVMPVVGSVSAVSFAWASILAIFGAAKQWWDRTDAVCAWMKQKSWGIYIFHYLPMSTAAYLLHSSSWIQDGSGVGEIVICYMITFLAGAVGSLVLYEFFSRIPILRWCILGLKKEKTHVQG